MAGNNYIVLNSKFKPFSFQEMLAPVAIYDEAYDEVEKELINLNLMGADAASKLTSSTKDEGLKRQILEFQKDLDVAMNDFYVNDLNSRTRKSLNALKTRYTKDVNPVNEAYKAYQEAQKYLSRLAIEHPEILIESDGQSVSDYINGKTPQMKSVNLNTVIEDVAKIAKAESLRNVRYDNWKEDVNGKLLTSATKTGLTEDEFNKALFDYYNGDLSNPYAVILGNIYKNQILKNNNLNNPDNIIKLRNAIETGLRQGFAYDEDRKYIQNPGYTPNPNPDPNPNFEEIDLFSLNAHDDGWLGGIDNINEDYKNLTESIVYHPGFTGGGKYNPMALYEEMFQLRENESRIGYDSNINMIGKQSMPLYWNDRTQNASMKILQKYNNDGITQILTDDEYQMLKDLGYNSKSAFKDFENYETVLNEAVKVYLPSRTDLASYDIVEGNMKSKIVDWKNSDITQSRIYEYNNGRRGKGLKKKQVPDDFTISNVSYTISEPDFIIVHTDKGKFYMSPNVVNNETAKIVKEASNKARSTNDLTLKSNIQEITTELIRQELKSHKPQSPKTQS